MEQIKCPKCSRIVLDTNADGSKKLRSRMLLFENGGTVAICPGCKWKVAVPVTLDIPTSRTLKHVIMRNA